MSDIDDVIRRSREPGQFSERKEFTIAKDRAIEKMRKFALKTPSHYILELIQGAVANGATYIDIFVDSGTTRIAWTGGVFPLEELQQIFDFLFTDNEDRESAAIRQLAVGVNALLAFKPKKIIIESGDGTIENSTRIEIEPKTMHVTAGRPANALKGTFILAEGKKLKSEEEWLIGERCLTLNIPIIVNDRVLFGYSSVRSPNLLGVKKSIKFDEGDFYGTVGLSRGPNTDNFKILTHGVWIQTQKRNLGIPQSFGGIIAFDHLNKTVDHAAIVEDEVWNEMWARVSLLARELISDTDRNKIVLKFDGQWTDLATCRRHSAKAGGAILFRDTTVLERLVPEYEKIYGFPGFIVKAKDADFVTDLLGNQNLYIAEGTQEELNFLRKPKIETPKGPFFLDPLSRENHTASEPLFPRIDSMVRDIKIYTPRALNLTKVEFVERGRLSESFDLPNAPVGFHIRSHIDPDKEHAPDRVDAQLVANLCSDLLLDLSTKIANDYATVVEPDTTAAFHVLRALSSTTIFSIDDGRFSIRRLGLETNAILNAPILRTLDGAPKSILEIVALMNTQHGLVYGCVQGVSADLSNLDKRKILALTPQEEKEIIGLFGDSAYVRIDDRDILATHTDEKGNTFTIRDIAVGLGEYDSKFICCENNGNITLDIAILLIGKLKHLVLSPTHDSELRRQSLRHLIWILTHENSPPTLIEILERFPLFRNHNDEVVSFIDLEAEIEMLDGWPIGPIALPKMNPNLSDHSPSEKTKILALNPFVFHMLSRKKKIVPQSNNIGNRTDLRNSVLSSWIDNETERGTVSLMPRQANKTFSVINPVTKQVHVHDAMAGRLMCAGEFFTERADLRIDSFLLNSIKLFGKAARLIDESDDLDQINSLAEPAFFGSLQLIVTQRIGSFHRLETRFSEIDRLLRCKIFPTKRGVPVSALTLTQSFENPSQELHDSAPAYQAEWLERVLNSQFTRVAPKPSEKINWKEHFFLPAMESISTDAWLISFVSEVTKCNVVFSESKVGKHALVLLRPAVISINRELLAHFSTRSGSKGHAWLALEVLAGLSRINRIDTSSLQDHHRQIADLILEREKNTKNTD